MRHRRVVATVLVVLALISAGCAGATGPEGPQGPTGPAGPQGPPGEAAAEIDVSDLSCTECHNDTTLIWSKEAQFRERSVHGTGEAFERGENNANCAGCHGTEGAKARIDAGLPPHDPSVQGITNVSPYDCRTCHQIHMTYTSADWTVTGSEQPVVLEMTGGTFDKGAANLCANCHQIRNELPDADAETITIDSARFGTHHGVEAQMLLGEGGLGVTGSPSPHYELTDEACITCHMGDERNHTYEPQVERCTTCHADIESFDLNGTQTEIRALLDEVKALLIASGIMSADFEENGELQQNRSVPGDYPAAVVAALWNYMFVVEDQSMGVHNPAYAGALLEAAKAALQGS